MSCELAASCLLPPYFIVGGGYGVVCLSLDTCVDFFLLCYHNRSVAIKSFVLLICSSQGFNFSVLSPMWLDWVYSTRVYPIDALGELREDGEVVR